MTQKRKKSRLAAGLSCSHLGPRSELAVALALMVRFPGPDDWGLAVAVRASDRRPVADRASDWGSGSAGPASLWGWTSGSPWLNLVGHNPKPVELVSREPSRPIHSDCRVEVLEFDTGIGG